MTQSIIAEQPTAERKRTMSKRAITAQRKKLAESMAIANDRLKHWASRFNEEDAVKLEYFAHGMEGVMDLFQNIANEAGYLAELIDPNVQEKV